MYHHLPFSHLTPFALFFPALVVLLPSLLQPGLEINPTVLCRCTAVESDPVAVAAALLKLRLE